MKVVAFNGSPRKNGNTSILLDEVLGALKKENIETEHVHIGGKAIQGCTACMKCKENMDKKCVLPNDQVNEWMEKAFAADGILLGSPTYFSDMTPEMKAFIDRLGYVNLANGNMMRRKIGASVVAVRRGGGVHVFDSMNHLFQISEMIIVSGTYWNLGFGREKGEVKEDHEGIRNMRSLGENMAWLLHKINT